MDKIFIRGLKTETIIGIFDWERQVKQTMMLDIEFTADVGKAALSDSIDDIPDNEGVAQRVRAFVEASRFNLVETLAVHVAMLILEQFEVAWVSVVASKPGAVHSARDAGVSLERDRADLEEWRRAQHGAR